MLCVKYQKVTSSGRKICAAYMFINIDLETTNSISASVIFLSGFVPSRSHHEVSLQNIIKCHLNT